MNDAELWDSVDARLNSLASPDSLTGLAFVRRVFERLGNPYNFPAIHIAGTNGKGSTSADLDAMLRAQGYKCALFTSPHLVCLGERLLVNGAMLPPQAWHEALDSVERAMKEVPGVKLGYFQLLTAACFLMIEQQNVDAAVIETGLGGRYDTTNILPRPLISLITPLGMDHMKLLGNTLSEIAENKFDIIKEGSRALYCGGSAELNERFRRHCRETGARGEILAETCRVADVRPSLRGSRFVFRSPEGERECFVRLPGLHQPENAALALRALELLSDALPVSEEAVARGLGSVQWPGRMEVVHSAPDVILDGAHNPHGTRALVRSLVSLYGEGAPLSFVYTSMADKDYSESLRLLSSAFPASRLFCTELSESARCEKAETLASKAASLQWGEGPRAFHDPAGAIREAVRLGHPVVVCGSLYFIGRIRGWARREL